MKTKEQILDEIENEVFDLSSKLDEFFSAMDPKPKSVVAFAAMLALTSFKLEKQYGREQDEILNAYIKAFMEVELIHRTKAQ